MGVVCWHCGKENVSDALRCAFCNGPSKEGAPFFIGRYRVVGFLGSGSYGKVFRCHDDLLMRDVAIKVLSRPSLDLEAEIVFLSQISSDNIVHLYDGGSGYLVMELVEGVSLDQLISTNIEDLRKNFTDIFKQICEGLRVIHERSIVHRDLKPSNIMVGPKYRIKITDFGVAKKLRDGTWAPEPFATLQYTAPEVWLRQEYDQRIDIFSLGVICYLIWTGKLPFDGNTREALSIKIKERQYEPPKRLNSHI
ncbi:MAG: serine/threonine-protein kinase, partial [Candidatus Aminicenantales bacterium]